jgi:hypothetical protein
LQVVVEGTDPMIEYVSLMPYCWSANLAEALSQSMNIVNDINDKP